MKRPRDERWDIGDEEIPPPRKELPPALRPLAPVGSTIAAWWRDLFPLSLACFAWALLSLTVIGGPPAGAALYSMCRATILHEDPDMALFLGSLRAYFVKSWLLGLVSAVGTLIWLVDLVLYSNLALQVGPLAQVGLVVIFYIGLAWLQTLFYAWALMVCRPDLKVRHLLRNGLVLALRNAMQTYVGTFYISFLFFLGIVFPALFALLIPVQVALLGLYSVYALAPELVPEDVEALAIVG